MTAKKEAPTELRCIVCGHLIPEDRVLREAVTCTRECAAQLRNIRRRKRDLKKCRYCNQPSTPEERRLYAKWRESQGIRRRPRNEEKSKDDRQTEFTEMIHVG